MSQNLTKTKIDLSSSNIGKVSISNNVVKNDLLNLDELTGKARVVEITDYASVGNMDYGTTFTNTATGQVIAPTLLTSYAMNAQFGRISAFKSPIDSNIYFATTTDAIGTGFRLMKLRPNGELLSTIDVETITNPSSQNRHIFELSNGNICAVTYTSTGTNLKFAIYDKSFNEIKALTTIASINPFYYSVTPLVGGGFAVAYADGATPRDCKMAVYDNAGTVVTAPTTVWTRPGTPGNTYYTIKELSNGNLIIAINSKDTGSVGLYYLIYTPAGVSVKAATNIDATNFGTFSPTVEVLNGYFCITRRTGVNQIAHVFNNAGTIQGSPFSGATTMADYQYKEKLLTDGTYFYLIWQRSADSKFALTRLPSSGSGYVTVTLNIGYYDLFFDAFYDPDGFIVVNSVDGIAHLGRNYLWTIDISTMTLVYAGVTLIGQTQTTNNGNSIKIFNGGDKSFISFYSYESTPAGTFFYVGKYSKSAIIGVAAESGVANSSVKFKSLSGFYEINPVKGSLSKAFDMSSNKLIGNKGTIIKNGSVVLKGIGV